LTLALPPVGTAFFGGLAAYLHGISPVMLLIIVTTVAAIAGTAAAACALMPHLPSVIHERSRARVRKAAVTGKISVNEAVALNNNEFCPGLASSVPSIIGPARTGSQRSRHGKSPAQRDLPPMQDQCPPEPGETG
jgi:hypothetical protein